MIEENTIDPDNLGSSSDLASSVESFKPQPTPPIIRKGGSGGVGTSLPPLTPRPPRPAPTSSSK